MIAILIIIGGIAAGVMSRKLGFLWMWSVFLCAVLAIYASVMLSPTLMGWIPALSDRRLLVGALLVIGAGVFTGLLLLTRRLFSSALEYCLPDVWDQCGAGLCGWLTGYLVINYVVLLASVPWLATSSGPPAVDLGALARCSAPTVAATCGVVHRLSWQRDRSASQHVVDWLGGGCEVEAAEEEHQDGEAESHDSMEDVPDVPGG